ncbi:hypothetical protein [Hymenobacter sublimis]|uniref:Uncharacterized protein n=1 Tax=Hymenobacter sublimis TaxID=2933777 RepID=A0ABY4JF32_9BACT|nr:hypothetical protein [Hymenobacter sublimis]UPL50554.1 hypothetical protein MWH26_06505 [Hymenobacter sublimis]
MISRFKTIHAGPKRLLIVISVVVFIAAFIEILSQDEDHPIGALIFALIWFVLFWVIVRIVLWIIDGFYKN